MNDKPELFDRDLLRRRRERFAAILPRHDFLLRRAAGDMLARLDMVLRDFDLALDIGAGHGLLSPALAARGNIGRVIAMDESAALLRPCRGRGVEILVNGGENIPLAAGSLNLAISLLALNFINDLPAMLADIRRSLAPDGLFMAALPGGRSLFELRQCFMRAEEEIWGGVSPRIAPMADIRDYGDLLMRAGFALPVVDSDIVNVSYGDFWDMLRELRAMGGGNVLARRRRGGGLSRRFLQRAKEICESEFADGEGRLQVSFEIIHLSGWAPHESQQKPLAPGSVAPGFSCHAKPFTPSGHDDGNEDAG